MNKISVYTILYYDLQFYEDIIKYLYDIVDEFIIIDGPYSYSIDTLKKINLFYDEQTKPYELNDLIKKYSKIKYKYVICDTEEEKRMIGYNMCSNNLVLLVDTDEFLNIDTTKLNRFINNQTKFVCCANIYNMCDYNVNFNKLTEKYILFKKSKISALEHLDYTWLISCKQNEKIIDYMSCNDFGLIYHYTLNRNIQNNIIKFVFYILLYRKTNNQPYNLVDGYNNDDLIHCMTSNDIINIVVRGHKNRINIPTDDCNLQIIEDNEVILNLKKYNKNLLEFYFINEMKCLLNVPVCFRLNEYKKEYILVFENVLNVEVNIYYLYLNLKPNKKTYTYQNLSNNMIKLSNELDNNAKYMYIELICNKTCNEHFIFTLKNIL
tara:strand:+ start:15978 stop:17114 length:1137 start_codon:yes stop_codon:yes gene_type:complete